MFHFEPSPPDGNLQRRRAQLARLDPPAVYKRAVSLVPRYTHCMAHTVSDRYAGVSQVVMLRSLTSYTRLLPGYRMYRACKVLTLKSSFVTICAQASRHSFILACKLI